MGDEDEVKIEFSWTSLEAGEDAETEPAGETAKFVKRAGRAKVQYPNGDTYEGGFNEAKQKHGAGVYTWSTAEGSNPWLPEEGKHPEGRPVKYDGEYSEGKKSGVGQIWYPNGDRYHGEWKEDDKQGDGTYFYANGDIYSGTWTKGKRHGKGAYVFKGDQSQLVGDWTEGALKNGKWVFKDGSCFVGRFKDNKPLGKGVFYFPSGNQQEGSWKEEGDEDDPDAPMKLVWIGGAVAPSSAPASAITAAPLPPAAE